MDPLPAPLPIAVRRLPAAQGIAWWTAAFGWLFADGTGLFLWIAMDLCTLGAPSLLQTVPVLGWIGGVLLSVLLQAGLMVAAQRTAQSGATRFEDLFGGFGPRSGALLAVGALGLVALGAWFGALLIGGAGALFGTLGGAWNGSTLNLDRMPSLGDLLTLLWVALLGALLLVPIFMALWLAPPLVVLRAVRPLEALRLSFVACWRNSLALLVYSLGLLVLAVAATVPLFLGWLILLPAMSLAKYAIYRDVFADAAFEGDTFEAGGAVARASTAAR
jgi:uncharacterized membrane protein